MDRLLITGGSGLLATNWACCMRDRFDVVLGMHRDAVTLRGARSVAIDLESPDRLVGQLRDLAPDLVVHAAGMTNVEQCQQHPIDAERANTGTAANIAVATQVLGTRLVHISTDHLFNGDRARVSEDEQPQPLNVYARTKWQAEEQVAAANSDALIVRTNFFGWGHAYRQSFSDWIINSLRSGQRITMFDDVFFTPILADELARTTHEVAYAGGRGIFHIVGDERVSKFEFANRLAGTFGLPKELVVRGRVADSALAVLRPYDMSLDNAKARSLLKRDLGMLDGFLDALRRQEQQGRAAELRNAVTGK